MMSPCSASSASEGYLSLKYFVKYKMFFNSEFKLLTEFPLDHWEVKKMKHNPYDDDLPEPLIDGFMEKLNRRPQKKVDGYLLTSRRVNSFTKIQYMYSQI